MKLKRKTSEQKKAFQAYEFALRQEDRYLGSSSRAAVIWINSWFILVSLSKKFYWRVIFNKTKPPSTKR